MSCQFHDHGTFCNRPCKSCDDRMRWRAREARIRRQRDTDRLMRTAAR